MILSRVTDLLSANGRGSSTMDWIDVLTITASVTTNKISVSFDALINCFVLIYVSGLVALP